MANLRLQALQTALFDPVSLEVPSGLCLTLHGPSGAGKTLLLRAIVDLDPNQGEVWLGDLARRDITAPQWRRRCIYVPAESHWWADTVRPHAQAWDDELLTRLGFEPSVLDWDIARLSSGEKQRLTLARAFSLSPEALLLDEPTANLDKTNTAKVETIIAAYRVSRAIPILWVSHDIDQRQRIGQRSAYIAERRLQEEPRTPSASDRPWN